MNTVEFHMTNSGAQANKTDISMHMQRGNLTIEKYNLSIY